MLGKWQISGKSLKWLELISKYSAGYPKNQFWQLWLKIGVDFYLQYLFKDAAPFYG